MTRKRKRETSNLVLVDVGQLMLHIQRLNTSKTAFADRCQIGRTSLYRMINEIPVKRSTVAELASELQIPTEALLETDDDDLSPEEQVSPWHHPEWQVIPGTQMRPRYLSNGLVVQTAKVRHRELQDVFGRAKVYDISGMPSAVREQCRETLTRHATVCRKLEGCPYVANNLTLTSLRDKSIWTAIDRWDDGHFLSAELDSLAPMTPQHVCQIARDICYAVSALHEQGIILRELHPDTILVRNADQRAVITDLELAKLLEVESTVSSNWQPNPYRAPEVAGGVSTPQADIYSVARLITHLLTGSLPSYPADADAIEQVVTSPHLRAVLIASLSPNWRERPQSIIDVQDVLNYLENTNDNPIR